MPRIITEMCSCQNTTLRNFSAGRRKLNELRHARREVGPKVTYKLMLLLFYH